MVYNMEVQISNSTADSKMTLGYITDVILKKLVVVPDHVLVITGYKPKDQVMKAQWKKGYGLFPDGHTQYLGTKSYNVYIGDEVQVSSDKAVNRVTVKSEGDLYYLKNLIELGMGLQEDPKDIELTRVGYDDES